LSSCVKIYPRAHPLRQALTQSEALIKTLRKSQQQISNSEYSKSELFLGEPVIFGWHVHGLLPFNSALMTVLPDFCRREHCVVVSDAFTHVVAGLRDLGQWLGSRECTREAIGKALDNEISVVLVPGGVAETFMTRSWDTTVFCYRGHRGFIRLALAHHRRVVPVFSFGEWELLDNVYWPRTQALTRRYIGFPIPFLPHGLCFLPLPRRPPRGITIVQGAPIDVETFLDRALLDKDPKNIEQAVEKAHQAYFNQLFYLFEKYKANAGYPNHKLIFIDAPFHPASSSKVEESPSDSSVSVLPPPFLERNFSSWEDLRRRRRRR